MGFVQIFVNTLMRDYSNPQNSTIVGAGFPRPQVTKDLSENAGRETKAMLFPLQVC